MIAIEDKIILEALEPEKLTSGGVILPDTSTEASDRGKVLQVGPGKMTVSNGQVGEIPMQCEVGDIVAYPKNLARKVEVDGNDYYVIREPELLMIISRKETKGDQQDG
jgi:chaperonin GroES